MKAGYTQVGVLVVAYDDNDRWVFYYPPEVRRGKYWRWGVFLCNTSLLTRYENYCLFFFFLFFFPFFFSPGLVQLS